MNSDQTKMPEKEQTPHQINERMMARWTRKVGLFTGGLVVVGIITAWILYETDQTARVSQRAYVISNEILIEPIRANDGTLNRWIISPIIENAGSTGTVNAAIVSGLRPENGAIPEPTGINNLHQKQTRQFTLGPKSRNSKIIPPMHITPDLLPSLRTANPRLFVLGEISYEDVFETPHITKYCYFLWAYPQNIGIEDITYSLCTGRSNCTDKECEQKR